MVRIQVKWYITHATKSRDGKDIFKRTTAGDPREYIGKTLNDAVGKAFLSTCRQKKLGGTVCNMKIKAKNLDTGTFFYRHIKSSDAYNTSVGSIETISENDWDKFVDQPKTKERWRTVKPGTRWSDDIPPPSTPPPEDDDDAPSVKTEPEELTRNDILKITFKEKQRTALKLLEAKESKDEGRISKANLEWVDAKKDHQKAKENAKNTTQEFTVQSNPITYIERGVVPIADVRKRTAELQATIQKKKDYMAARVKLTQAELELKVVERQEAEAAAKAKKDAEEKKAASELMAKMAVMKAEKEKRDAQKKAEAEAAAEEAKARKELSVLEAQLQSLESVVPSAKKVPVLRTDDKKVPVMRTDSESGDETVLWTCPDGFGWTKEHLKHWASFCSAFKARFPHIRDPKRKKCRKKREEFKAFLLTQ